MTRPRVLITSRYPDDLIAEFERHAAVRRECGRGAASGPPRTPAFGL